jgi:protein O-mannosyl-transferase
MVNINLYLPNNSILIVEDKRDLLLTLSFCLALFIVFQSFQPGLTGPFILDDEGNLRKLGAFGQITSLEHVVSFVFGNHSGPLGRPVSMISFLLNDNTWPAYPESFKYTNLMIHLLNGVLIFLLSRQIISAMAMQKNMYWAPLFISFIWMIHPFVLSTIMTVVQRMTELSALFVFAGMSGYLYGRKKYLNGQQSGFYIAGTAVLFGGVCAVFSKENGVLLPLFLTVIELTLLSDTRTRCLKIYYWFALIPSVLFLIALLYKASGYTLSYQVRDFSLYERLMTETRVLCDYIYQLIMPKMSGVGLFHDDFVISRSLITPITTLYSLAVIAIALFCAIKFRKRWKIFSFGVLWFFTGHLLESTFIPLEIYFEHRNYAPSFGLIFSSVLIGLSVPDRIKKWGYFALLSFSLLACFISYQQSKIWGNSFKLAMVLEAEHPGSVRAAKFAANEVAMIGQVADARKRMYVLSQRSGALDTLLQLMLIDCSLGVNVSEDMQKIISKAQLVKGNHVTFVSLIGNIPRLLDAVVAKNCKGVETKDVHRLLEKIMSIPILQQVPKKLALFHFLRAKTYIAEQNLSGAMHEFDKSFFYNKDIIIPIQQAYFLNTAGLYSEALEYLTLARKHLSFIQEYGAENELLVSLEKQLKANKNK